MSDAALGSKAAELWAAYPKTLAAARKRRGRRDAVEVGVESFDGLDAVVARLDFDFLGGSMGRDHGDAIVAALDRATRDNLPFVSIVRSGGARMQEGFDALFQMARTSGAMARARKAGVPTISWLRHPTTGGVHASYASASDVLLADRGATLGFAGPRVMHALAGVFPMKGSHTAEQYFADGLIDELVDESTALSRIGVWLRLAHPAARVMPTPAEMPEESTRRLTGWDALRCARDDSRPTARQVASEVFDTVAELGGARTGTNDDVMFAALASLGGAPVVVIGTDRNAVGPNGYRGAPTAAGFRKAQRAIDLASRWKLPIVTLIDTRGADASTPSDRAGLANAIAETAVALMEASVPTVAAVVGEGGSGGAMALAVCDRLLMQDDAVFEVIAPEGAAAILFKDPGLAADVADQLGLGAAELRARGYSDYTLSGPSFAGAAESNRVLRQALTSQLALLSRQSADERGAARHRRYGASEGN
ncbi:carboxyl transferase domain-containing protein [Ruicaihuangia caeni]|uniref:Acetyl-coenzyme A carboxylase carboxyl transferase subunits beta/alpha n=1 Tax=Ruicaihuangia caeni TaxID=3042517 RepID=A0AAW6TBV8_9MICO|nr:carboxyl transferase domain-containing protein [Klugiella sp. YN-L-19]MDI2099475.1 carboxyl transferase domain-containing protein [Klugiella sp. YN-L-19]